ncbi:hypothetical protein IJ798_03410 [Candidatus Saccharibacteria bacterium]|nr:hypothetical protein [Candidatus Saccharibacteria bacterium]
MSDFVFIRKSRNALSSALHVILNIALAAGSIYITWATNSFVIGLILVLLSKWRMFAVRPRYWALNLKSNLVDLIVGCSFIFIAYSAGAIVLPIHFILAIIYSLWLIVLKPKSSELATDLQSIFAVFFGTIALTLMTASADSIFLVLGCFVIGYASARHVLVQSDDEDYNVVTLVAGIISAEVAWLCHSWLIVYSFSGTGIIIPQLSIILTILSYLIGFIYKSLNRNEGKINWSEIGMPTIFSILVIALIVIWFSQPIFNV